MNKQQRKIVSANIRILEAILEKGEGINVEEFKQDLDDVRSEIEIMKDEEQDKYDNLPESLQWSERADQYLEAVESLEDAYGEIDCACEASDWEEMKTCIESTIEKLEEVM